jgi:hypothetical protein
MKKLHGIDLQKISIIDLGGVSNETALVSEDARGSLGELGNTALDKLKEDNSAFRKKLVAARGSLATPEIQEGDKERDGCVSEVMRTSNAAAKSSNEENAAAGKIVVMFMFPYHNVQYEPLISETSTLSFMQEQYYGNEEVQNAAAKLQLTPVFEKLFEANERVSRLWKERSAEEAAKSGPSASSLRGNLEKSYYNFCDIVVQTLNLTPSPELEKLFFSINEIRIKYTRSLPVKLTEANTSVAIVPVQKYTGKAITPIPTVSFKTDDDKLIELRFTIDFYVTYRNNIKVGEAKLIIHGKGKYTGKYSSTFHIEN